LGNSRIRRGKTTGKEHDMPVLKVRVSMAGGASLDVETENGTTIAEIFEALADQGFSIGEQLSKNGVPASAEDEVEDGDAVSSHKTPEGA